MALHPYNIKIVLYSETEAEARKAQEVLSELTKSMCVEVNDVLAAAPVFIKNKDFFKSFIQDVKQKGFMYAVTFNIPKFKKLLG